MLYSKFLLHVRVLAALCLIRFSFGATLVKDEVQVLSDIASTLNKTDWDFSVDPCSGSSGWVDPIQPLQNSVDCNCSFSGGTICHVVSIVLKSQNLSGTLPTNLGGLPYLQQLDLTKNYLSGSIPPQWGSTKLVNISLLGNRLTGPIPKEVGNISTLEHLTVEYNKLFGVLPAELGNLSSIQTLFLTSNYFSGKLPETLSKLTTLIDFRIGDNPFTGTIPTFIQNLTNLQRLIIQGTNLSGPIPSGIGQLQQMTDLRISDLINGIESQFPQLSNMTQLNILILRSCNIVGEIPNYLGAMTSLQLLLDLSFNKLTGGFPSNFIGISAIQYMYLTGNMLSGEIPDYILKKGKEVDLSYNNFSTGAHCQIGTINLFASSSMENVSKTVSCLQSYQCPNNFYSMNINCGGQEVTIDGTTYEEDTGPGGPSTFYQSNTNWAFSNTGNFIDDDAPVDNYIQTNTTPISANASTLYLDARISPLSLSYYGFCLGNGNYTVYLHFAEIKFTADKSYMSLGRRFFNVYIQGELVLKDFNIEDEAGGVGLSIIKNFTAVVSSSTLEIRFYWAGKGTNAIPSKGVFGPLISAISVTSNFPPPSKSSGLSTAKIVGITIAAVAFISLFLCIFWWKCYMKHNNIMDPELKGIDLQTGSFTLRQIKAATKNFDPANKIGEGGFGSVYKGLLLDGTTIAVKQLSSKSKQGNREFVNEIGMISALQHPHLVKLYGCCVEGNQLLLVYEYMENNSLARALSGPEEYQLDLDWPTRQKICIGIARGLAFLHEESRLKIVHRDIKATNVLLDENLNPKISDFGLAKLNSEEDTHISTRIAGTYGYMAPEYAMRGYLTNKADVYSFGVVALEIVSGKSNTSFRPKEEDCFYLLDWALVLKERGNLLELVDPRLGIEYNQDEVINMINVALLCTNVSPAVRPLMSSVVSMLEGRAVVQALVQESGTPKNSNSTKDEIKVNMPDGPWTTLSSSNNDLYPVSLDSSFMETMSFVKPHESRSEV